MIFNNCFSTDSKGRGAKNDFASRLSCFLQDKIFEKINKIPIYLKKLSIL